jgi:mRNA-degrading endonuclease RelE of RelBE toxin-antitoxin system
MARLQPYSIGYVAAVAEHLQVIEQKYHSLIRAKIQEQLSFEPGVETINRKRLRQPAAFGAEWEIRFGPGNRFRVLYTFSDAMREVCVLAIGVKDRNRLFIGDEEIML